MLVFDDLFELSAVNHFIRHPWEIYEDKPYISNCLIEALRDSEFCVEVWVGNIGTTIDTTFWKKIILHNWPAP